MMIGLIPAARCSGHDRAHVASTPPPRGRAPVAVTSPVPSSKSVLISLRTCRACESSSVMAAEKKRSLSWRRAAPPCVPSRRSAKWRRSSAVYSRRGLSMSFPFLGVCAGRCQILASGAPAGQAADRGGVAVDPGSGAGVVEDPLGDLVLPCPPHVLVVAEPSEYPVQDADPGGVPGQALVQAYDHHPAPRRSFGVQLVELVGQLLGVGGRVEPGKAEAGNVVEVHRIRHGGERLPIDRLQERLVGGQVV